MNELTMKYMTACLKHDMSKKKEKKHQSDDVAMVLHQDKWDNLSWYEDVKTTLINWAKLCIFAIR